MLMESWEPYLDFYKPAISTSVSFEKLTLGTVAPRFKGGHHVFALSLNLEFVFSPKEVIMKIVCLEHVVCVSLGFVPSIHIQTT